MAFILFMSSKCLFTRRVQKHTTVTHSVTPSQSQVQSTSWGFNHPLTTMEAIINIYECVYRTESGKELYTKTWYAPTWEHAFRMAEIYRTVTLHEAFDFILKRI